MVIYNSNFKLIGMSNSILNLIGYPSFDSFCSKYNDIYDLFLNDQCFADCKHYTQYLLQSQKTTMINIKTFQNTIVKCIVFVDILHKNDSCDEFYMVCFLPQNIKNEKILSNVLLLNQNYKNNNKFIPNNLNIFVKEYEREILANQEREKENELNLKKSWLDINLQRLELDESNFILLLEEFINKTVKTEEFLHEMLLLGEKENYINLLINLKDSAQSLGIKSIVKILHKLENLKKDEISATFREYHYIITQMRKNIMKRKDNEAKYHFYY
ncbi:hypothetical protein F1B92_01045 [Campylobacter sp. FMV-PI01]|uniref:HPt domain-containing protein n=1 Tax=Campylobacter portucalensis TaxID=2608384 RepID=A0A6L5WFN3_9BACT|nr:hypothetical protein [Campylobacter portucalensis]MSN95794.1 hypothetical protein [Campylobacter portucalensis]